jgi:Lrp/AsnC family transcriptional regulator for asnA, asnC and gidA
MLTRQFVLFEQKKSSCIIVAQDLCYLLNFYVPLYTFFKIIMGKIDELDRKILSIITQNARIPFKDVAEECNVSRAAIHQRVQRLIELKVITGSGYYVDPKALGYQICAYIGITLEKGSMYKKVVPELEKIPEVVECTYTLGPYSILIKIYAKSTEHLMQLLNGKIQEINGVVATETLTALDQRIQRQLPIQTKDETE